MSNEEMTVVPRWMLLKWLGNTADYGIANEMEHCLDAPAPRLAGPGDVVIPAVVVEENPLALTGANSEWEAISINACGYGDTPQAAINSLAAALEAE